MTNLKWIPLFLAAGFLFSPGHGHASPICQRGPECEQIRESVARIKDLKVKRHEDVRQFGRDSSEVKQDDQSLTEAMGQDHELRADRKSSEMRSTHRKRKRSRGHPRARVRVALRIGGR